MAWLFLQPTKSVYFFLIDWFGLGNFRLFSNVILTTLVLSVWSFWLLTISLKFAYSHSYKVRNNSCQVLRMKYFLKGMRHLLRVFARNVSLRLADKAAAVSCPLLVADKIRVNYTPWKPTALTKRLVADACPSSTQPHTRSEKQSAENNTASGSCKHKPGWFQQKKNKYKFIPLVPLQSNYRMTILTKK